ncbi:MAG: lytic murein transglycosylase [Cereibacter sphaeroides]|uniref:Lytic murein transglycosylase n=1 Tax=Cereibacter sphaeroides TaxID=1063 RepID=A0A2W5UJ85_CERSP|nr:MAG: lytic murein transglycosylase [Cereibacter sphaeroides]
MRSAVTALFCLIAAPVLAAPCGGDFSEFVAAMKAEALAGGADPAAVDAFFKGARQDPKVLKADRSQSVFQKPFVEFSGRLISKNRLQTGEAMAKEYDAVFAKAEADYGVPRGILLAFWAFETDFGKVQGDFNTRNALFTLAHDCRRPDLFQPQILAGVTLTQRGMMDPAKTTGAWAGEIGMVQMLPADIIADGVDGDGDGEITLKTSAPDALLSAAKKLHALGWVANEPWLVEISLPKDFDWSLTGIDKTLTVESWQSMGAKARTGNLPDGGLRASVLLPQGRDGPAFLAFQNFNVLFNWNKSFAYVTTAAYFATRMQGSPAMTVGEPQAGLSGDQMKALQEKLGGRGHDVGKVDGILGAQTRAAVQKEQVRLGMPADAWPTTDLLNAL